MKRAESKISNFIKGRSATALMIAAGLAAMVGGYDAAAALPQLGTSGFAFPSLDDLMGGSELRPVLGIALSVIVGLMMFSINRNFNLLRTESPLFLGIFAILQGATPVISGQLAASVLLTIVVLGVLATFYTIYQRPRYTRRVFLAFCIMAAGTLVDYVYAFYSLIFLLAFYQMRCPSARMYLAALFGMVTPWWIALGFEFTTLGSVHFPDTHHIFSLLEKAQLVMMLVTVGVTVICCLLVCSTNMVKIYSYNSKARALSGLLAMLSLFTAIATLVDIANAPAYLSTLNCLTAFQVALFFRIVESQRGYVYILSFIAVYAAIYLCNIWL